MTLLPSLLREVENPSLSVNSRAQLCCDVAKALEFKGEYEKAREVLSDFWPRTGEHPNLPELEPNTSAEVLLRIGVLTGAIGSNNQVESQETAKNLIQQSLTIFQSTNYRKKIAEAQTELALCYWRTGELTEARDYLKTALSHLTTNSEVKAKAVVRLGIVECEAANYNRALRALTSNASLFERINNETLKGSFHVTLGTVLRHVWEAKGGNYIDRALIEYAAASYHFERAEHRYYLANVENQLGLIYFSLNQYDEAHQHLDRARRVLVGLRDAGTVAQVDETRASVFLKQGRIAEAEAAARAAVHGQEKTDRHGLLAEALITHGRALARLKQYGAALVAFRRAFDLSEYTGSTHQTSEAAVAAFRELGEHLAALESGHLLGGKGLDEAKRSLEHDAIKLALQNAKGSVVHAARNLRISFQALTYMLETRHKDLSQYRSEARPRPARRRPPKQ